MDAILLLIALSIVVCGGLVALKLYLETERVHVEHDQVLVTRLLAALETRDREEVANLLSIIGVEPREEVAARRQRELIESIVRERQQASGVATGHGQDPAAPVHPDVPAHVFRGQWDVPIDPDDLEVPFEDPTDLTSPLDVLPDATPPEQEQPWSPEEPVAFPEPVPEGEWRRGTEGFAPGENPLADIGIKPAWLDE